MAPEDFTQWFPDEFAGQPHWWQFGVIILLTFVSEDLTCLGAAFLSVGGALPMWVAWGGAFVGIWVGDGLLYGFARTVGNRLRHRSWAQRFLDSPQVRSAEDWFSKRGLAVLWICRWVPGTRLPSYLAAGFVRLPFLPFLAITGVMALVWTTFIFAAVSVLGVAVGDWLFRVENGILRVVGVSFLLFASMRLFQRSRWWPSMGRLHVVYDRWVRWEFWPPWLFYLPVAVQYLYLSAKYRGLTLPTVANPGIETGGMIGESKESLLRELNQVAPEHTATAHVIEGSDADTRLRNLESLMTNHALEFPVIIKPDVGQRGSGVRKVNDLSDAARCLESDAYQPIVQEYIPGPFEAGVFYYRMPGTNRGRIFSITDKRFPTVTGDGRRTLDELIWDDERARIMARVYRARFRGILNDVPAQGQVVRLVEAGNHAQGCVFKNGQALNSERLESCIDDISRSMKGFFVGRYDIRYESEAGLRERGEFKILELNGAAAEATSIYDPDHSLGHAYRTLFQQWDIVFSIGAANRSRGARPCSVGELWSLWRKYQLQSRGHPMAD